MSFDGSCVVTTDQFVFFWKPPAPFSQWTRSHFEVDGVAFTHAEQFMMAEKSRLCGDVEMRRRILSATDPSTQKKLGQAVRGFDDDVWHAQRLAIVVAGNLARFSQSDKLRRALLDTGDRELVEASPMDRIWGIGLRADDPRVHDPAQWRGDNLLGRALGEVRRLLSRRRILSRSPVLRCPPRCTVGRGTVHWPRPDVRRRTRPRRARARALDRRRRPVRAGRAQSAAAP